MLKYLTIFWLATMAAGVAINNYYAFYADRESRHGIEYGTTGFTLGLIAWTAMASVSTLGFAAGSQLLAWRGYHPAWPFAASLGLVTVPLLYYAYRYAFNLHGGIAQGIVYLFVGTIAIAYAAGVFVTAYAKAQTLRTP